MGNEENPSVKVGVGGIIQVEVEGDGSEDLDEVEETAYDAVDKAVEVQKELVEHDDDVNGDSGAGKHYG
jgi:hypothetical protein